MLTNQERKYSYILRFTLQPGHHEEENLEKLLIFCKQARIDDVMFFINCEELNNGHITREEAEPWLRVIARAKTRLEPLGITTSINPWTTLLHGDRGRTLKAGQNFRLMTDPHGRKAGAVVCPLCEEWRRYITDMYSYFATVKPNMIWVEDDFRFHNHAPLEWGGCFCEEHMKVFSEKVGKNVSREEFVKGILQPGEPHPYRKVWLDTCRETMVDLAERIGKAVHEISPSTKVGLMSSNPSVHCAEGRDWEGILKGLSGETPMVNRPTLPAYTGAAGQDYLWSFSAVSRMSVAVVPESTEIYPELENFPYTRFSKSHKFTRYQLETSAVLGSRGITLNIFDMMGNGVMEGEGYQKLLAESKDFLNEIGMLKLNCKKPSGVRVLFSPDSSYTLHTDHGNSMTELYPRESFWASLLSSFGIANTYSTEKTHKNKILAVSGQYFRNLNGEELGQLFKDNFIIMEAEAVSTLIEMGYGMLAGIVKAEWHPMDCGYQSFEQVCDGRIYAGLADARMSAQGSAGDFLEITYDKEPVLITKVINPYGQAVAKGMAVVENRVLILPYGRFKNKPQAHLNTTRMEIIQSVLRNATNFEIPVYVVDAPYVSVYHYFDSSRNILIMVNSSDDDLEKIRLYIPDARNADFFEMNRFLPQPKKVNTSFDGGIVTLESRLTSGEVKVFLYSGSKS